MGENVFNSYLSHYHLDEEKEKLTEDIYNEPQSDVLFYLILNADLLL